MMTTLSRLGAILKTHAGASLACFTSLVLAGCHAPGPTHAYLWSHTRGDQIIDLPVDDAEGLVLLPGQVPEGARVVGLAYDFNTDFIALRLEPGARLHLFKRGELRFVRTVALPAALAGINPGKVMQADLAFRPEDRHLFAAHPDKAELWELDLEGKALRHTALTGISQPLDGLAYDHIARRLLGLSLKPKPTVHVISAEGLCTPLLQLERDDLAPGLGCDAEGKVLLVPMRDGGVAFFDMQGHFLRLHAEPASALDAGPRSAVRVF